MSILSEFKKVLPILQIFGLCPFAINHSGKECKLTKPIDIFSFIIGLSIVFIITALCAYLVYYAFANNILDGTQTIVLYLDSFVLIIMYDAIIIVSLMQRKHQVQFFNSFHEFNENVHNKYGWKLNTSDKRFLKKLLIEYLLTIILYITCAIHINMYLFIDQKIILIFGLLCSWSRLTLVLIILHIRSVAQLILNRFDCILILSQTATRNEELLPLLEVLLNLWNLKKQFSYCFGVKVFLNQMFHFFSLTYSVYFLILTKLLYDKPFSISQVYVILFYAGPIVLHNILCVRPINALGNKVTFYYLYVCEYGCVFV